MRLHKFCPKKVLTIILKSDKINSSLQALIKKTIHLAVVQGGFLFFINREKKIKKAQAWTCAFFILIGISLQANAISSLPYDYNTLQTKSQYKELKKNEVGKYFKRS